MSKKKAEGAPMMVPSNFKFDEIFDKPSLSRIRRENLKSSCYFILDSLSGHKHSSFHLQELQEQEYFYRHSSIYKRICDNDYTLVLRTLLANEVIEEDGIFQPGVKSKGYRLSRKFDMATTVFRELSGSVRKRYLKYFEEFEEVKRRELAPLAHLTQWFDDVRLTIRKEDAHTFIELAYNDLLKRIDEASGLSAKQKAEAKGLVTLKRNHQIFAVTELAEGSYRLSNRGHDERLHSVLTGMKKELRSFLQFEGKNLISLDIRSSQPYLFTMLLKKSFFEKSEEDQLGWRSITNNPINDYDPTPPPYSIISPPQHLYPNMFRGFWGLSESEILEKSAFFNFDWASKDLYLQILEDLRETGSGLETRSEAKHLMMWLLFEYGMYKYTKADFKAFEERYPIEAGVIRGVGNVKEKLLPIILQRLESRIMLGEVTKAISEALPTAPLFTVHDSVMTTPEHVDQVSRIMELELERVTGLKPGITVEGTSPENQLDLLEDFVGSVYEDTIQSILKPKRRKSRGLMTTRKRKRMSFAGYPKVVPLLYSIPKYKGTQVFSPGSV